jgi:hypothetical protein
MFQTYLQLDTGRKSTVGQEDYFERNVACTVLNFTEIKLFRKKLCNLFCQNEPSFKKCTKVSLHVINASFVYLFSAHVLKEARIVTALNWDRKYLQRSSML